MRVKVKETGALSVVKINHRKEIRASHELGLSILTPSLTSVLFGLVGALVSLPVKDRNKRECLISFESGHTVKQYLLLKHSAFYFYTAANG